MIGRRTDLYGVIDIGSNTIRLMVYRVEDGAIHPVLNKKYATGLAVSYTHLQLRSDLVPYPY